MDEYDEESYEGTVSLEEINSIIDKNLQSMEEESDSEEEYYEEEEYDSQ